LIAAAPNSNLIGAAILYEFIFAYQGDFFVFILRKGECFAFKIVWRDFYFFKKAQKSNEKKFPIYFYKT
jgi:hypothetical protein